MLHKGLEITSTKIELWMRLDVVGCGWMWMDVHFSMCPLDSPVLFFIKFLAEWTEMVKLCYEMVQMIV